MSQSPVIAALLAAAAASSSVPEILQQRGGRTASNPSVYRLERDETAIRGKRCTKLVMEYNGGAQDPERPGRQAERWLAASCVQYNIADLLWDMEINTYSVLDIAGRTSCGKHSLDGIPDIVVEGALSLREGQALNRGDFRSLQDTLYGRTVRCATKDDQDFFEEAVRRVQQ